MTTATDVPFLPAVPPHWVVNRFGRDIFISEGQVDPRTEPWSSSILIAPNHIEADTGRLLGLETAAEQGADSGKYLAKAGQVLYSKIRPALNKVALAPVDCLCSADMYAIDPQPGVDARYLAYYMRSRPFHAYASVTADRVKMPKINREELATAPWARPPLGEQLAIADFLDEQTSRIDRLIDRQSQLIATLRERRTSCIDQSLGAARGTSARLRRLFAVSSDANSPDEEVLSVYRDYGVIPKSSRADNFNKTPENVDRYLLVQPGDLVVNRMKAWQGSLGVSAHRGIVSGDYEVLRPRDQRLLPAYTHYLVRSPRLVTEYRLRSTGIRPAQWRLYWESMADIRVTVPSHADQVATVQHLDAETSRIDILIEKTEQHIELAKERRAALITAAVTGQVDVRTASRAAQGVA